jgi:hypothetical protein
MTVTMFIVVPVAVKGGDYLIKGESASYQHAMAVLVVLNLIIFVNENTKIFKKKPIFLSFTGEKRIVTVGIALILWVTVLLVTIFHRGKELVWLMWIATSLCISGFHLLYILMSIVIESFVRKSLIKDVAYDILVNDTFNIDAPPKTDNGTAIEMANLGETKPIKVAVKKETPASNKPYEDEKLEANKLALATMNEEMHGSKEFTL